MKGFNGILFSCVSLVFLVFASFSLSEELIAPTRTLQNLEKKFGYISIFSEPPGLEVFLNNSVIGQTPIFTKKVESGVHELKIKDSELELNLTPGKSLRYSFRNGFFFEIREKEMEGPQIVDVKPPEKRKRTEKIMDKVEKEENDDPFYWPTNPSGPIK